MRKMVMLLVAALLMQWTACTVQAADQDLAAAVEALQAQVAAQSAKIQDLEARQGMNGADIDKMLAEMAPAVAPNDFRLYWKDGIRMESANGDFKLAFGGRYFQDVGWISCSDQVEDIIGNVWDGTEIRAARLHVYGTIYRNVDIKWEYDFNEGDPDLKDGYIKVRDLGLGPVDWVKFGHYKEPFSLEELTSSRYITFMERALPNVFSPGRNTGLTVGGVTDDKRMTWTVGGFRPADDYGEALSERGYHVTGRVTWNPINEDKGRQLLHIGGAYSYRTTTDARTLRYRQRPEYHQTARFVDTAAFAADHANLAGVELGMNLGSLSLSSEYMMSCSDASDDMVGSTSMKGAYVQASYFLTGEHRPYKTSSGTWNRVKPIKNYGVDGSLGALEVKARYSYLDVQETNVQGGRLSDLTAGVNWYLNPNVRFMMDYVRADLDRDDATNTTHGGTANIFMMRAQFDF